MFERDNPNERRFGNENEQENYGFAAAIANRMVAETLALSTSEFVPDVMLAAYTDALTKNVAAYLKMPTPFAALFDNPYMIMQDISDGDLNQAVGELVRHQEEDLSLSAQQIRETQHGLAPVMSEYNHVFQLPEFNSSNLPKLIQNARDLSRNDYNSADYFLKENLYRQLMQATFTEEEFLQLYKQYRDNITLESYLRIVTISSVKLIQLANDDPSLTVPLSEEQISENMNTVRQNQESMNSLINIHYQVRQNIKNCAYGKAERFWGDEEF